MKSAYSLFFLLCLWQLLAISQTPVSPGVYIQEIPSGIKAIRAVGTTVPVFIGYTKKNHAPKASATHSNLVRSYAEYQKWFGGPTNGYFLAESVKLFFQNGGSNCYVISVGLTGQRMERKNLYQGLIRSNKIAAQLVLMPDVVALPREDFYFLQDKMILECAKQKDRFAILQTMEPTSDPLGDFQNFRQNSGDNQLSYGAVYYPWLITPEGKRLPPSGAVAGAMVQNDTKRGVWKAPANIQLASIQGVSTSLNRSQQQAANVDATQGKSINAIVPFTGKGILIWGARTLAGNDNEWRYVSVRRFAIMLEQSVRSGLDWVVFEPNAEPLWAQARKSVQLFMQQQWRNGALQGTKPEQAFYVKCGLNQTMTAADVQQGRMIMEVGFAPLKPAEFIILRFEWKMR